MRNILCVAAPLAMLAMPAVAREATPNPQIDYSGFGQLVRELGPVREAHRLAWREFSRAA